MSPMFAVRTVADWSKLEDNVITADSGIAFSSAVGRVLLGTASHTYRANSKKKCLYNNKVNCKGYFS